MKQQVVFINGAVPRENFDSFHSFLREREYNPYEEKIENWNKTLGEKLGDDYEYLRAPLDDLDFANYQDWKIMFEKMFPYFHDEIILVTTSLGSSFILKYFGKNDFPVKIKKLFLIAPAVSDTPEEKLWSFKPNLEFSVRLRKWVDEIYIYHSRDDQLVPFEQSLELHSYFPESIFREFDDRGHFYKEMELPELIQDIQWD